MSSILKELEPLAGAPVMEGFHGIHLTNFAEFSIGLCGGTYAIAVRDILNNQKGSLMLRDELQAKEVFSWLKNTVEASWTARAVFNRLNDPKQSGYVRHDFHSRISKLIDAPSSTQIFLRPW